MLIIPTRFVAYIKNPLFFKILNSKFYLFHIYNREAKRVAALFVYDSFYDIIDNEEIYTENVVAPFKNVHFLRKLQKIIVSNDNKETWM